MGYENLLIECDNEGINVKEKPLKANDGLCKGDKIAIKNTLNSKEKHCTLSEEYGHYKLTVGDITDLKNINNMKQEIKARRWGYEKIAGLEKIADAINKGAKNRYEIADMLEITDDFLDKVIHYFRLKYGVKRYCKGITFYFEPYFAISKDMNKKE